MARTDGIPPMGRSRSGRNGLLEVAIPLVLGVTLLVLGIPRTVASWASLEALPALEKFEEGQFPTQRELTAAEAGLTSALDWLRSSSYLADLAGVERTQAVLLARTDARRPQLLARAERHFAASLAANPVQPYTWLALSQVRIDRDAGGQLAASAMVQSIATAPNWRPIWMQRLELLLPYWRYLDAAGLRLLCTQIRTIWGTGAATRGELIRTAVKVDQMAIVVASVDSCPLSPDALKEMQAGKKPPAPQR